MVKYQAYAEYKDSEVEWLGQIPKTWDISRLKYTADIFGRIGFRGYTVDDIVDEGEGALVLSPSNILGDQFSLEKKTYLSWKKYYESPEIMVELNDILLVKTGSTYGKSTIILEKKEPMTINPQMALLKKIKLEPRFLYYLFQSTLYKAIIDISNTGSGMPTMTQENINSFPIPSPDFNEALNIANFLDHETAKIDHLIEKQQQLIELLKEKRQAVISHAVTKGLDPNVPMKDSGVAWLGKVPEHWTVKRLKHISPKIGVGLVINPSNYTRDEGVYFIFGGDVKEYGFDLSKTRRIAKHDSDNLLPSRLNYRDLVSIRVGYPGITAVVTQELEGANCASVIVIRKGKYNSDWLCAAMNIWVGRQQVELASYGAAQKQFNVSDAIEFIFPVPPEREQNEIANFVEETRNKFDSLSQKAEAQIALLKERRTALISAAVTGKIDVRNWQAPTVAEADTELSA